MAGFPLMVRHHFLMRAAGDVDAAAVALIVNTPDTVELLVVLQDTAAEVALPCADAGGATRLMVRIVLMAVRFDESVTVIW